MAMWVFIKKSKKVLKQRRTICFSDISDIGIGFIGIIALVTFIIIIVEAIFEIKDLTENYSKLMFLSVGPLLGFPFGILLLLIPISIIRQSKRSLGKLECAVIITFSVVGVFFIMLSLRELLVN
jgi:hypothetical protein